MGVCVCDNLTKEKEDIRMTLGGATSHQFPILLFMNHFDKWSVCQCVHECGSQYVPLRKHNTQKRIAPRQMQITCDEVQLSENLGIKYFDLIYEISQT